MMLTGGLLSGPFHNYGDAPRAAAECHRNYEMGH
jgi:hypothetical protein